MLSSTFGLLAPPCAAASRRRRVRVGAVDDPPPADPWLEESQTAKLTQAKLLRQKTREAIAQQELVVAELKAQEERFSRLEAALSAAKRGRDLTPDEVVALTEAAAVVENSGTEVLRRDPWAAALERQSPQLPSVAAAAAPPAAEPTPGWPAAESWASIGSAFQGYATPPAADPTPGWPAADSWASIGSAFQSFAALAAGALAALRAAPSAGAERLALKATLFQRVTTLDRGARASTADRLDIESLVAALAQVSPTASPALSVLAEGRWNVVYTTSTELLGAGLPTWLRPAGPLYLTFNSAVGRVGLDVSWPQRSERGQLSVSSRTEVRLSFTQSRLFNLLPLPSRGAGEIEYLDTLYLDGDLRIMRGGNSSLVVAILDDQLFKLDAEGQRTLALPAGRGK